MRNLIQNKTRPLPDFSIQSVVPVVATNQWQNIPIECQTGFTIETEDATIQIQIEAKENGIIPIKVSGARFFDNNCKNILIRTTNIRGASNVVLYSNVDLTQQLNCDRLESINDALYDIKSILEGFMPRTQINGGYTGAIDGNNDTFVLTLPSGKSLVSGTCVVDLNGQRLTIAVDYNEVNDSIVFLPGSIPQTGNTLIIDYQYI